MCSISRGLLALRPSSPHLRRCLLGSVEAFSLSRLQLERPTPTLNHEARRLLSCVAERRKVRPTRRQQAAVLDKKASSDSNGVAVDSNRSLNSRIAEAENSSYGERERQSVRVEPASVFRLQSGLGLPLPPLDAVARLNPSGFRPASHQLHTSTDVTSQSDVTKESAPSEQDLGLAASHVINEGAISEEPEQESRIGEEDAEAPVGGPEAPLKMPLYRLPSEVVPLGKSGRIRSAQFIKSSADVSQCPQDGRPEIAVIGRSNVGKSSLINMLTHRKELAQTSKKPGKTQLINHFLINDSWYLVDLPGYGYAKAPKGVRTEWHSFTQQYFLERKELVTVLLLVDASIPPLQVDLDCADWMGQHKIPLTVIFTKCDRRKKKKNGGKPPSENVADFEQQLSQDYEELPPWIMTSSVVSMGKDTVLSHISQLIAHWKS